MAAKATLIIAALAMALSAGGVTASEAAPTAADLADLQARLVLAKAQADLAEVNRKISGNAVSVDLGQQATGTALPVVTGVYGRGRDLYASFLYSNGLDWEARAGMTAPGGYLVRSVGQDRVVLSKAGQSYVLGFSGSAPAEPAKTETQPVQSSTMGSPFLPLPPAGK